MHIWGSLKMSETILKINDLKVNYGGIEDPEAAVALLGQVFQA